MAHPYESLSLGPVPSDETCQQVGMPEYDSGKARQECLRFIELLEKLDETVSPIAETRG